MDNAKKGPVFTEIVLEVFKLGGLLVSEGDQMGAEFGITSARWKVLGALSLGAQSQTVPQIARNMGLTRQAVQRLVDAMESDGLLQFADNPDHKRAKLISVTEHGQTVYSQLDAKQSVWAMDCSEGISADDLATTLSVLRLVSSAIDR